MDDRLLVSRARSGDREALDALLRSHYDAVYAVCRRMTGNDTDAADAAQDALVRAVRGLGGFDSRARFSTWLHRIAVNASLDEIRRRTRRPIAMQVEELPMEAPEVPSSVVDRIDIDAALMNLAVEFRSAVVLRDLCGFDYAEIAEALGIPVGTAKSRVSRGRAAVAQLLGGGGVET